MDFPLQFVGLLCLLEFLKIVSQIVASLFSKKAYPRFKDVQRMEGKDMTKHLHSQEFKSVNWDTSGSQPMAVKVFLQKLWNFQTPKTWTVCISPAGDLPCRFHVTVSLGKINFPCVGHITITTRIP